MAIGTVQLGHRSKNSKRVEKKGVVLNIHALYNDLEEMDDTRGLCNDCRSTQNDTVTVSYIIMIERAKAGWTQP